MSAAAQHFTAVVTVHATTTTPETDSVRDTYGREVRKHPTGQVRKDSTEVLKLQLRGDTLAEVAAKVGNVLGVLEAAA